jgi:hypothetical protein
VKTIVRRRPIRRESRTAAWNETAWRIPIEKKTTASVSAGVSNSRANQYATNVVGEGAQRLDGEDAPSVGAQPRPSSTSRVHQA